LPKETSIGKSDLKENGRWLSDCLGVERATEHKKLFPNKQQRKRRISQRVVLKWNGFISRLTPFLVGVDGVGLCSAFASLQGRALGKGKSRKIWTPKDGFSPKRLFSFSTKVKQGELNAKMNFRLLASGLFASFLTVAFLTFLGELWIQQQYLNTIWVSLSLQQRALENIVLGIADLKLILTALCIIFFAKFWGD